ncbi:MAG TPA: HemK2/MTQ2 family protein methyltransferase [Thermoplasmata archaeon]|nr:HemK2/MTQ2 family protein methyltransferase [Thermoplasmata archaeon]
MDCDPRLILDGDPEVCPAAEDSALLLAAVEVEPGERFLEVGVGGGLVALHAALVTEVVATDANPAAVRLASRNAETHRLPVRAVRCDLMGALRGLFDVVVFNPPYLEAAPATGAERAWAGGEGVDRTAFRFLRDLPRVLVPTGRAYLLLGDDDRAARAFAKSRFRVRLVDSKRLFVEKLEVLELRLRGARTGRRLRPTRCAFRDRRQFDKVGRSSTAPTPCPSRRTRRR